MSKKLSILTSNQQVGNLISKTSSSKLILSAYNDYDNSEAGKNSFIFDLTQNQMKMSLHDIDSDVKDDKILINQNNIVLEDNVSVTGTLTTANLEVTGTTTTINTNQYNTENLVITNDNGQGPAFKINQNGETTNIIEVTDNTTNILKLTSSGNLGIGIDPTSELHVFGDINYTGKLLKNGSESASSGIIYKGMIVEMKHNDYKKMQYAAPNLWSPIDNDLTTGFVINIKPKSINSLISLYINCYISFDHTDDARWWGARLYRKIGNSDWTHVTGAGGSRTGDDANDVPSSSGTSVWFGDNNLASDYSEIGNCSASYLDTPNTLEDVYYTIYWKCRLGANDVDKNISLNRSIEHGDSFRSEPISSWTVKEIWNDGNPYTPVDSTISISGENVGINNTNPQYNLDISGNINFTGNLTQNNTPFSSFNDEDAILLLNSGYDGGHKINSGNLIITKENSDIFYVNIGKDQNDANVYTFNNINYETETKLYLNTGTYYFKNIPESHPLGFVINDTSLFEVTSGTLYSNQNVLESITVNYYTGDITVEVKNDFGTISYACYFHGYMGGNQRLEYSTTEINGGRIGIGTNKPTYKLEIGENSTTHENKDNIIALSQQQFSKWGIGITKYNKYPTASNGSGNYDFEISPLAGSLGNILLIPKGGYYVGINKTNPQYTLDINGNINFSGQLTNNGTQFSSYTDSNVESLLSTTNKKIGIGITADANATLTIKGETKFMGTNRNSHINYLTDEHTYIRGGKSASYVLLNDNGGNVGVGTGTPNYTLDVNGNINFTGELTKNGSPFTSYSDNEVITLLNNGVSGGIVSLNDLIVYGDLKSVVEGTENIIVSYSDEKVENVLANKGGNNITWNTSTKQFDCDVINTDVDVSQENFNSKLITRLNSDVTFNGNINIKNNKFIKFGVFSFIGENIHDQDSLSIIADYTERICFGVYDRTGVGPTSANTTEYMRIDENGRVGIGLTNPSEKLHIKHSQGITSPIDLLSLEHNLTNNTTHNGSSIKFIANWQNTNKHTIARIRGLSNDSTALPENYYSGFLTFETQTGGTVNDTTTERMRITNLGNVGIGVENPSEILHILGSFKVETRDNETSSIDIKSSTGGFKIKYDDTNNNLKFITDNSGTEYELLTMDRTNNRIGIGTNLPEEDFHIKNGRIKIEETSGNPIIHFKNNYNTYLFTENNTGKFVIRNNDDKDTVIDSTGNVGIGTTAPEYKLHVNGTISCAVEATWGEPIWKLNIASVNYQSFGMSNGSSATNNVAEALCIQRTGNVGIGISSPTSKLDVNGNTNVNGNVTATSLNINGDTNITGTLTTANLSVTGTTTTINTNQYNTENLVITNDNGQGPAFKINQNGETTNIIEVTDNTTNILKLTSSGNLGIGLDPTEKLDIDGNIKFTGSINNITSTELSYLDGLTQNIENNFTITSNHIGLIDANNSNFVKDTSNVLTTRIEVLEQGGGTSDSVNAENIIGQITNSQISNIDAQKIQSGFIDVDRLPIDGVTIIKDGEVLKAIGGDGNIEITSIDTFIGTYLESTEYTENLETSSNLVILDNEKLFYDKSIISTEVETIKNNPKIYTSEIIYPNIILNQGEYEFTEANQSYNDGIYQINIIVSDGVYFDNFTQVGPNQLFNHILEESSYMSDLVFNTVTGIYTGTNNFKNTLGLSISIDLGRSIYLRKMRFMPRVGTANFCMPKFFKIFATNLDTAWNSPYDGSWTLLHDNTTELQFNDNEFTNFGDFSNITSKYKYFTLVVTELNGNGGFLQMTEFSIIGVEDIDNTPQLVDAFDSSYSIILPYNDIKIAKNLDEPKIKLINQDYLIAYYDFNGDYLDKNPTSTKYNLSVSGIPEFSQNIQIENQSIYFNQNNEFLSTSTNLPIVFGTSFSFWFKKDNNTTHDILMAIGSDFFIMAHTDNKFYISNTYGGSEIYAFIDFVFTTDWYHFVFVFETDGTWKIYINGEIIPNTTISGSYPLTQSRLPQGKLYIGGKDVGYWNNDNDLEGYIDNFRVYNIALSNIQINTIYNDTVINSKKLLFNENNVSFYNNNYFGLKAHYKLINDYNDSISSNNIIASPGSTFNFSELYYLNVPSNEVVTIPNAACSYLFNTNGESTFAFWVKVDTVTDDGYAIFGAIENYGDGKYSRYMCQLLGTTLHWTRQYKRDSGSINVEDDASISCTFPTNLINEWVHLAFVSHQNSNQFNHSKIYINGISQYITPEYGLPDNNSISGYSDYLVGKDLLLGGYIDYNGTTYHTGSENFSDIRIYDRGLESNEIIQIINSNFIDNIVFDSNYNAIVLKHNPINTDHTEYILNFDYNIECDILVVAGGGGGGRSIGGGGGAGGLDWVQNVNLNGTYNILVGRGGIGYTTATAGENGKNSKFNKIDNSYVVEATGGGGSWGQSAVYNTGQWEQNLEGGNNGGSGGGGTRYWTQGGDPVPGEGNHGGTGGFVDPGGGEWLWGGGGGGGAGSVGSDVSISGPGKGGEGRNLSAYFGTSVGINGWFAGGGGGGGSSSSSSIGNRALGGTGGGGAGAWNHLGINYGENGYPNTGGGGGGGEGKGGNGGSGIVIIKYKKTFTQSKYNVISPILQSDTNNLIAKYSFEYNLNDESGNNHHLIGYNTKLTYVDKVYDNCSVLLNGTNGETYLEFPDTINLYNIWNNGNGLTFSIWFNMLSTTDEYGRILEFAYQTIKFNNESQYRLSIMRNLTSNHIQIYWKENTTNGSATIPCDLNVWNNLVFSVNKEGLWSVYLNNIDQLINITFSPPNRTYNVKVLGRSSYSTIQNFNGLIDDFRIYNKVLSSNEIKILYESKFQTIYNINVPQGIFSDILLVGGGGSGGGTLGGGGGGGGVLYKSQNFIPTNNYVIRVGKGGDKVQRDESNSWNDIGINGNYTSAMGTIVFGGGGGGNYQSISGSAGGSGGGGGFTTSSGGQSIQPIYGDIIINGTYTGSVGESVENSSKSGDGGNQNGFLSSITGTQYVYAKGGTGSENSIDNNRTNSDGINYGDGGGGGGWTSGTYSGEGADGVVILNYKLKSFNTSNYIIDTIDTEKLSSGDLILLNNGGIRRVFNTTENYFTLFNEEENDIGTVPIGTNGYQKLNHLIKFTVNGDIDNGSIYIDNQSGYSKLTIPFSGIFTVKLSIIFNLEFATEFCEFHIRLDRIGYKSRYIRTFYLPPISTYSHDFSSSLNTSVDLNLLENDILVFESNFKLSSIKKSHITFTNSGTTIIQGSLTQNIYNSDSSDSLVFASPLVKVDNTVQFDTSQLNFNYQFQSPLINYNNVISISDNYYANYSHQHDASVITSGILSIDRIPSLTSLYSSPTDIENTSNYIRNIDAKTSNIDIIDQDTINFNSKIGIQTNNVSHKVTITGDGDLIPENNSLAIISDSSPQMMLLGNQTSSQPSINLIYDYTNFDSSDITTYKGNQIVTTGQYFKIYSFNGDSNERFCIDSITGNVGIGTTPNAKLHVDGALYLTGTPTNPGDNISASFWNQSGVGSTISGFNFSVQTNGNTERLRIDENGNIGININNPSNKLSVKTGTNYDGIILNNENDKILFKVARSTTSQNCYLALYDGVTEDSKIVLSNSDNCTFNSGNVGIGTTTPSKKLDVNGDVNITGTLTAANLDITGSTTTIHTDTYTTESLHIQSSGTDAVGLKITHDTTSFNIMEVINSSANQVFTIDSSGNVGIGIFPQTKLHVQMSNNTYLRVETDTNAILQTSGIEFGIPAFNSNIRSKITSTTHNNDASDLRFYTNPSSSTEAQTRMIINQNGYIGIGTSNPTAKLHIPTNFSVSNENLLNFKNESDYGIYVDSLGVSSRGNTLDFKARDYNFNNISTRNLLTLRPEGNVGFNNTLPETLLTVGNHASLEGTRDLIRFASYRHNEAFTIRNNDDISNGRIEFYWGNSTNSNGTHDNTLDNLVLTLSNNGNIGFGISNPRYKIDMGLTTEDVAASANKGIISLYDNGGNNFYGFGLCGPSNNEGLGIWGGTEASAPTDSNCALFVRRNSGNIGIGTVSPSYKLDVNGSINCTGLNVNGSPFSGGGGLWTTSSTTVNSNAIYYNQATLSGSAYAYDSVVTISGEISDHSITGKMGLLVSHSNRTQALGIGFNGISQCGSSPNLDFNIKAKGTGLTKIGTNSGTPLIVNTTSVGIGTTNPQTPLHVVGNTRCGFITILNNDSFDNQGMMFVSGVDDKDLCLDTYSLVGGNMGIDFRNEGSSKLRITKNGNIGIGTTNPSQKLEVQSGNIMLSGSYNAYTYFGDTNWGTGVFNSGSTYYNEIRGYWVDGNSRGFRLYNTNNNSIPLFVNANGNVGIGTTAPGSKLDVNGSVNCSSLTVNGVSITTNGGGGSSNDGISITTSGSATNSGTSVSANMGIWSSTYAYIDLRTNNDSGSWIDFSSIDDQDFKVRLRGYNNPQKLEIVTGSSVTTIDSGGNLLVPGDITAFYSDERLKKIKTNISDVLSNIDNINVFRYENNHLANSLGFKNNKLQIGLSAQEIQKYYPELVELAPFDTEYDVESGGNISKSGENYLTLKYDRLVPILLQGIKELNDKNKLLEEKNNKLENDLQLIKNKLGL